MAWRPHRYLIAGTLDNTEPRKVTGQMYFIGLPKPVMLDLDGDFHRDIRGTALEFQGYATPETDHRKAAEYMERFSVHQTGEVGDMTAGLPPHDYGRWPYLEWFGHQNGRVVLELGLGRVRVVGTPIPYIESDPISREKQKENMAEHMRRIVEELQKEREKDNHGSDEMPTDDS